jgi:hypothetical protein
MFFYHFHLDLFIKLPSAIDIYAGRGFNKTGDTKSPTTKTQTQQYNPSPTSNPARLRQAQQYDNRVGVGQTTQYEKR